MRITLATTNRHKMAELLACAAESASGIEFVLPENLPDVEENGTTLEANALIKAQSVAPVTGTDCVLGEDTGLVVDALKGLYGLDPFPGVQTNRWLTPQRFTEITGRMESEINQAHRNEALLCLMKDKADRRGRYVCAMALYDASKEHALTITGTLEVDIALHPRGQDGFGYDPVTIPAEMTDGRTTAELTMAEKNEISHRGRAFQQLLKKIRNGC